jgi:thioredoxin reductase (NADPH)
MSPTKKTEIPVKGFFVAIGHKPNSDVFKDYITTDDQGYVTTVPGTASTNVKGRICLWRFTR